jgi:hypothetical protein
MKNYKNYLNELINSRKDLITINKSEILDYIDPALMTQDEYLKNINRDDKYHEDSTYDYSLDKNDNQLNDDFYKKNELLKQMTIGKLDLSFYIQKEKTRYGYCEIENDYESWV